MSLNSPADLAKLIDLGQADGQLFLDHASLVITERLTSLVPPVSTARLKMIELYLGAHFATLAVERGGLTSSKTGDSSDSYVNPLGNGNAGDGFNLTRFGQQALALDTSGVLVGMTSKKMAQFRVL